MVIKRCVGAVLYDDEFRIFLMTSPKWGDKYIVPGGEIEEGEREEDALGREMREELGIEIYDLQKVGEKVKPASSDFKDGDVEFHFVDYFARVRETEITPNDEVDEWGWFSGEEALRLPLLDTTRKFVEQFVEYKSEGRLGV